MRPQSVVKGTLYLGFARLVFILSGYIVHIGLGRILGPSKYGLYAVTISLLTTINLILAMGIPQAISKFVSENLSKAEIIKKVGLKIQFLISMILFIAYLLLSHPISIILSGGPDLLSLIRISAIAIPTYAIFSALNGYLNGLRFYKEQSIALSAYHFSKILLVLLLATVSGIFGAVFGFALSSLVGLTVVILLLRNLNFKSLISYLEKSDDNYLYLKIIKFGLPITVISIALNLSTTIDLLILKAITKNAHEVGYYSAASVISKIPYMLLGALNMALFPAISNVTYLNNVEKMKEYIRESFRYILIFLVPVIVFISVTSTEFISLLFSQKFFPAGEPLKILIIGILFFSIVAYLLNIITASGKVIVAMGFSIFLLILSASLNLIMIPLYRMIGAATAVTSASLILMLILMAYTIHRFGAVFPWTTILKVCTAVLLIVSLIFYIRFPGILLLVQYLIAFALYFIILIGLGEIKEKDIMRLKKILFLR